jgi:hypothetical protein
MRAIGWGQSWLTQNHYQGPDLNIFQPGCSKNGLGGNTLAPRESEMEYSTPSSFPGPQYAEKFWTHQSS